MPDSIDRKPPLDFSREALFRHRVISCVLVREQLGEERSCAVDSIARCEHRSLQGGVRVVSRRTLYRWLADFARDGVAGLEPLVRAKTTTSVALAEDFVRFLRKEKEDDPEASIPEIIRRAKHSGVIASEDDVCRVTVYRAAVRMGLALTLRSAKADTDMRRFAHPHRMRCVLADGKHFRAGRKRTKRVVLFFIDDCTRRVLTAVVGPSESTELFLRGLYEVCLHFGFAGIVYLDNGPGFASDDTDAAIVRLGSLLILGTAGYPEGHGKVERFNRTAWNDLLRGLLNDDVDDDCGALELRCRHYIEHIYNPRFHDELGMSPLAAWNSDPRPLTFPDSERDLRECFVLTETRRVSKDNIVAVYDERLEVPRGHAGELVALRRDLVDSTISMTHKGEVVRLHPVDLAANAEARRVGVPTESGRKRQESDGPAKPVRTAADRAFRRDYAPLVNPDGGLRKPPTRKE